MFVQPQRVAAVVEGTFYKIYNSEKNVLKT